MTITLINHIGIAAGICTTVSFVPQIVKILKTREAKDVSLCMYVIFTFGVVLWLAYGLLIQKLPVIIANIVALVLCSCILIARIKYGRSPRP